MPDCKGPPRERDEMSIEDLRSSAREIRDGVWRPENTRENVTGGDERRGLKAKTREAKCLEEALMKTPSCSGAAEERTSLHDLSQKKATYRLYEGNSKTCKSLKKLVLFAAWLGAGAKRGE